MQNGQCQTDSQTLKTYICLYEFNLFHYVGVVAKRSRAAAETAVAHKGDDNTHSGPGVTKVLIYHSPYHVEDTKIILFKGLSQAKIIEKSILFWLLNMTI